YTEQELSGQRHQEQEQVHMRRIELRDGDVLTPGDVARAGQNQGQRKYGECERRRIEDVRLLSVTVPPDQLLAGERQRNHQKLHIEPVLPEPQKQVCAEDDRELSEPQRRGIAS